MDESATCKEYLHVQLNWLLNNMKSFIRTNLSFGRHQTFHLAEGQIIE